MHKPSMRVGKLKEGGVGTSAGLQQQQSAAYHAWCPLQVWGATTVHQCSLSLPKCDLIM